MSEPCAVGRKLVGIDVQHEHDLRTPCPEPAVEVNLLWGSHDLEIGLCQQHLAMLIVSGDILDQPPA